MCLFRAAKWIYRSLFPSFDEEINSAVPKDKFLVLRPDGSWILDEKNPKPTNTPQNVPIPSWHNYGPIEPVGDQVVTKPPTLFPYATELDAKLTDCIGAGVISGCTHIRTKDMTYKLSLEVPFNDNSPSENTQINLFVRVMEQKYKLSLVKRHKHISTVSSCRYHILVFEYDPRKQLFKE